MNIFNTNHFLNIIKKFTLEKSVEFGLVLWLSASGLLFRIGNVLHDIYIRYGGLETVKVQKAVLQHPPYSHSLLIEKIISEAAALRHDQREIVRHCTYQISYQIQTDRISEGI